MATKNVREKWLENARLIVWETQTERKAVESYCNLMAKCSVLRIAIRSDLAASWQKDMDDIFRNGKKQKPLRD